MSNPVTAIGINVTRNVVKIDKRIMSHHVRVCVDQGKKRSVPDTFLVGFPRNPSLVEQTHQMIGRGLMIDRNPVVIADPERSPRLQPEIVREARAALAVILLTMRCLRQQYIVNVRRVHVTLDRRPRLILHHNQKHRPNRWQIAGHDRRKPRQNENGQQQRLETSPPHRNLVGCSHLISS